MRSRWTAVLAALAVASAADAAQPDQEDLKRLTIEELMRIDVTTATRTEQPIGTTAAAISVITADEIRRSGATSIAEALRLADGVHVTRLNNGAWRISARGMNGVTPNKLLVMVDGRTVYSSLFTGVFWNVIDYPLEDIDRIEVIRGPGAALWGANAVNGVVNIITRHSRDTQGAMAHLSVGNEERGILAARYGGGDATTWRVYGKFAARDAQRFASGASSEDERVWGQGGFRVDGGAADRVSWTVTGNAFQSREGLPNRDHGEFTEASLQGRASIPLAPGSQLDLQSYYRREYRRVPLQLTHHIDVFDLDAQHTVRRGGRHQVVWGGGVRVNWDETEGGAVRFSPEDRTYALLSVFAQDEIAIVPQRLYTTLGMKYEHNAFSGGELQPNARLRWIPSRAQLVWGAVSRAVRRPTRLDSDVIVPGPGDSVLVQGTGRFQAEKLTALEAGYRVQPSSRLSLEATAFWHEYDDLRSQDAPVSGLIPVTIGNTLEGRSRGVEVGVNVQPVAWWRTHVGYTRLDTDVRPQPGSRDVTGGVAEANDPDHLFGLHSSLDLPRGIEVDAVLEAVGALPNPRVPAYTELTLRAGWQATPRLELFAVGDDLLHDRHPEAGPPGPLRVEFERSFRAGLIVRVGP